MEREYVNVFTAVVAKELLKKGYHIADLKQDKYDPSGKRSIFVFRNADGLEEEIGRVIMKIRNSR